MCHLFLCLSFAAFMCLNRVCPLMTYFWRGLLHPPLGPLHCSQTAAVGYSSSLVSLHCKVQGVGLGHLLFAQVSICWARTRQAEELMPLLWDQIVCWREREGDQPSRHVQRTHCRSSSANKMYKDMSHLWIATSPESPASIEQSPHKWLCECLVMINGGISGTLLETYMFSLPAICTSSPGALRAESASSFAPLCAAWAIGKAWQSSPGHLSHVRNIVTTARVPLWEHKHISWCLRKHRSPPCSLGAALLEGLNRGKNFFLGYWYQLTWLWCPCVSRQHFHIYAVCFNMSNSWWFSRFP